MRKAIEFLVAVIVLVLGVSLAAAAEEHGQVGIVTSASAGKLAMTDDRGDSHSFAIGENVTITINGKPGKLEELQKGTRVRVITDKDGKALTVSTLDARKSFRS